MQEHDRETPTAPDFTAIAKVFDQFTEQWATIARNLAGAVGSAAAELRRNICDLDAVYRTGTATRRSDAVPVRLPDPTVLPHTDGYGLRDVKAPILPPQPCPNGALGWCDCDGPTCEGPDASR